MFDDGQLVRVTNEFGAIEHYYHYMMGFLVPLIKYSNELKESGCEDILYVRSCEHLGHILDEVNLSNVKTVPYKEHKKIFDNPQKNDGIKRVIIKGYALASNYNKDDFNYVSNVLQTKILSEKIKETEESCNIFKDKSKLNVLLIERLPPPEIYHTKSIGKYGAGSDRRSITNINKLHKMINGFKNFNCVKMDLWGLTLAEQIYLFRNSDIILAQHGAVFSNLIFCLPTTPVIEFFPKDQNQDHDLFGKLSTTLNMTYYRVLQESQNSDVNLKEVKEILTKMETLWIRLKLHKE